MREILFRGKRSDNGEWVIGSLVKMGPVGYVHHFILPDYASAFYDIEIDPSTIGQYTGLTDKNGVKIFEGDILKSGKELFVVRYDRCGGVQNVEHEVGYVGFYLNPCGKDAEELLSYGMRTDIFYWLNSLKMEIVSNIHDNPELLEV